LFIEILIFYFPRFYNDKFKYMVECLKPNWVRQ